MQHQHIEIYQLGIDDVVTLRAVAIEAYTDHYAATWLDNGAWYIQNYFNLEVLTRELQEQNALFYGVRYAGELVGFLKLKLHQPLPGSELNAMELERIYFLKKVTGKGIGTYVLQFVESIALEHNKQCIWLKVMDTNPKAIRFYKKGNFHIVGTHRVDFIQKKEDMRGMFFMQKKLGN